MRVMGRLLLVVLIVMLSPLVARGEYYRYTDAEGNLRFTDNLAEVPEAQRPQVAVYQEAQPPPAPAPEAGAGEPAREPAPEEPPIKTFAADPETVERLEATKRTLDQEYAELMDAKQKLLQEKEEKLKGLAARDVKARQDYESRVKQLNDRIRDYETRREAFTKECAALDQSLSETAAQ
jgi:hypothetical protein